MRQKIVIVGGGVAGLMLACELDPKKFEVHIYERNPACGRKFLVAGDGGLNLTHSEDPQLFIGRYTPNDFLKKAFSVFTNRDLVDWFEQLGVSTFVGSSGRVFPEKEYKPVQVLDLILKKAERKDVRIHTKHIWNGFSSAGTLLFLKGEQEIGVQTDHFVFALGGASWPVTGSKGDWTDHFKSKGINIIPFQASNCSFKIDWPEKLLKKIEGKSLKNISISCNGKMHKGEVVLTTFGMEGSGIYPLSPQIRGALVKGENAVIAIDLKPSMPEEKLRERLSEENNIGSYTDFVRAQLNLNDVQIQLLKHLLSKEDFVDAGKLIRHIKNFKIEITGLGPLEDAISSVGGISLDEIDDHFQLKKLPGNYVLGEMLDYDAPTGGYLLQSCFSMGMFLAKRLNSRN